MADKLKVGFIGVGGISNTHVPGWTASPHAEIVAGADPFEANLKKWGAQHGITKLTTKPEELLADDSIDVIDICTPNMYHTPWVIAALEAGKHVICEKPLAPSPDDIKKMIAARDKSGKLLMTAQHFRFAGTSRAVKAEIEAGALGDIYHARGWMLRRNAYIPTPTFVYQKHAGGGACIDIGVHILDLTLWMMGNPKPVSVSGVARTELSRIPGNFSVWNAGSMPQDMDVEEFAAAFVRFDNGATLILEVAWLLHHDTTSEDMQMWLYGNKGGCHWPSGQFLSSNYATKQLYNNTLKNTRDVMEAHAFECFEFAQAITNGKPSPVPPEHSLQVLSILNGIYRSQSEGREVRLEL
jgi:predicted dehydrogenase